LFRIASECGAAEHCIPSSYSIKPENIVTASGFTPKEALNNFHQQLPQVGILQDVKLKSFKYKTLNKYKESTMISKSIFANFDYLTKYQCKKGLNYVISAIVPRKTISYIPNSYGELKYNKKHLNKFLSFVKAQKICGKESYHLITSNSMINFTENGTKSFRIKRIEGSRFSYNKVYDTDDTFQLRIMIVCGFNWQIWMNKHANHSPELIKNTWTHIVQNAKHGIRFYNYNKEMQLQMISNAIKGD
jgi:hypothetical protein